MVLTSFIEGLHDPQFKWELRKSKPTNPDAALALAVELHALMVLDPKLKNASQATVNKVSATPQQPLTAKASSSQEDMMGTLIQTNPYEIQKVLPRTSRKSSSSGSSSTDGHSIVLTGPDQIHKVQIQTKFKTTAIQTTTIDTITMKTIDTPTVQISKTADITTTSIHQTINKTETTQTKNYVDIVIERITNPGMVKPVLIAEDLDICLANVEHHDKIRSIGNKIPILTKTGEVITKTATQIFSRQQNFLN